MLRVFVYVLLFTIFLEGNSLKRDLIPFGYIKKDSESFIKAREINFKKETFKKFTVKLIFDKTLLKENTYYSKINCDVNSLVYSNIEYERNFDTIIIKLDEQTPDNIYFEFNYKIEKPLDFRLFILNEFEYKYLMKNENLLFGLAYGIIFSAFLYNFVLFLYTFQKSFLYYSLMQFFLMITLFYITKLVSQTVVSDFEQIVVDLLETFCVLLTILFSKEILNTKKHMRFINKVLNILIYINVVDLITILIFSRSLLYDYLPRSLVISLLVVSGIIALFKGQKSAIFYFLGWLVIFISLFIAENDLIEIGERYIIHIGFPLESLILSFALGYKLKQTVDEKKQKEKIMVHQSKLASMGEMINNIAHQWRQPLTHLSFINMDLEMANDCNDLSKKYLKEKLNESNNQIDFMSKTIDDFKDFYKPTKQKEYFYISKAVNKAVDIIKPSLNSLEINLEIKIKNDKKIYAYENEYAQVVLNFLTNAKDILVLRKIENPQIELLLEVIGGKTFLRVYDNAGGIEESILNKIFEPYFTTKDKSSGIGLYMSKIIIESHFNGEINVINTQLGACFIIEV